MKELILSLLLAFNASAQLRYDDAKERFYCERPTRVISQKNYHDLLMFLSRKTIGTNSSQFLTESILILRFMNTPTALQLADDLKEIYDEIKAEQDIGSNR